MNVDLFILYILYVPQHERKYKLIEKGAFNVAYKNRRLFADENYIYFYSTLDLNIEHDNVGRIEDNIRKYRLPIDKRTWEVLQAAKSLKDLTAMYDPKKLKYVPRYKNRYLENIIEQKNDFEQELIKLEQLEMYEDCATLRDLIKLNFKHLLSND